MADQDLHLTRAVDIYFFMDDLQIWTADIKRFSHVMYKIPFKSLAWWVVVGDWVEFMPTQNNVA